MRRHSLPHQFPREAAEQQYFSQLKLWGFEDI